MPDKFVVSTSPHIKGPKSTSAAMWLVCLALCPTALASIYLFGLNSLFVILSSVITCVMTEWGCNQIFKHDDKKEITITDGSAVVTGMLLAFTLPPTTPVWMVIIGAFLAIFLVKQLFGGLGYNIFNPALAARAILLSSWPVAMTTWIQPVKSFFALDATTSASVLGVLKEAQRTGDAVTAASAAVESTYSYLNLFLGTIPGSLGETCKLTLLAGAIFLIVVEIVDWRIPVSYVGTVAVLSVFFGRDPLAAVLSGGLILGACFMATDWVTSPSTKGGKLLFGACCGLITSLIRSYGGFPEGVCYSILFMNCLSPMIDKYVQPRVFGTSRNWFKKPAPAAEKAK